MRGLGVVAVLSLTATHARAETLMPLELSIVVDGTAAGDAIVLVSETHAWIPEDVLARAHLVIPVDMTRDGIRYGDLSSTKARWVVDEETGELRIVGVTEIRPLTVVSLATRAPASLEYASSPSAFLNYGVSSTIGTEEAVSLSAFGELGVSVGNALAYTSLAGTQSGVVRGLSNVSYDRRGSLVRFVAGDEVVSGGALGGGGIVGGVHVYRDFSIDPYFVAQPTLSGTGMVTAPSTLEVYRDGQLVRRELLPPGPFRVQDVAANGTDTRVVIRDPFGASQSVVATGAIPASALAPGLSQFAASIGLLRESFAGSSLDYGEPAALGMYRRGISTKLTLGGRAEATLDRASAGVSTLLSSGSFSAEITTAASVAKSGPVSGALAAQLAWRMDHTIATIAGRVASMDYATIELRPGDERTTREAHVALSTSPAQAVMLTGTAGLDDDSRRGVRMRASVGAGIRVGAINWSVHASVTSADSERDIAVSLAATRALGSRTIAIASASREARQDALAASVSRSVENSRGIAMHGALRLADRVSARTGASLDHGAGRAEIEGDWAGDVGHATVSVSGGVIAIGGRVKPSRAVSGAFALVRVPDAPNVRSYLDNHFVGATDAQGDLVITDLQPFYANRIRIDVRDLPLGIATDALERVVGPPRRGGAILMFALPHTGVVTGSIVGTSAMGDVDLSYAEVFLDKRTRAPIGHRGAFELDGLALGPHTVEVELDGRRCRAAFTLASPVEHLPRLACEFEAP